MVLDGREILIVVPVLSFDSLQASGTLKKETVKTQTFEVHALEVSLKQMQQVLNDVLDLQSACHAMLLGERN